MTTFINYIYHHGPFDFSEPVFEAVNSADLNVHVPKGAVGFTFVEAKNIAQAKESLKDSPSYFLGTAEQVCTVSKMQEIAEHADEYEEDTVSFMNLTLMAIESMNEQLAAWKRPPIAAYFFLAGHSQLGMFEKDRVIDPTTRQIVYPKPQDKPVL